MSEEQTAKRATKKALEEFCTKNEVSHERIMSVIDKKYPGEFPYSEELTSYIIKTLFKTCESPISDSVIVKTLELERSHIDKWSNRTILWVKHQDTLRNILKHINTTAPTEDIRLSQIDTWTSEMKNFVFDEYHHWSSCYDRDKNFSYAKAFRAFFCFWYYDHDDSSIPFHCYTTKEQDVLFTKDTHKWSNKSGCYDFEEGYEPEVERAENGSGCLGTLLMTIATGLLSALAIACC